MPSPTSCRASLPVSPQLSECQFAALGRLLCLLGTGEDAAALSFTAIASEVRAHKAASALAVIAREEQAHGTWVDVIAQQFPNPVGARPVIQASRRLHVAIGRRSVAERLAGVAALDSAACILFSRLLRPRAPLALCANVAAVLHRIHQDESRHVVIASRLAANECLAGRLRDRAQDVRSQLAEVLELVADDFEALAVDPAALLNAVRVLPAGLFAA
ncbi:MAG: hypothetical protein ABIM50_12380 [Novosphingobium sp.]